VFNNPSGSLGLVGEFRAFFVPLFLSMWPSWQPSDMYPQHQQQQHNQQPQNVNNEDNAVAEQ